MTATDQLPPEPHRDRVRWRRVLSTGAVCLAIIAAAIGGARLLAGSRKTAARKPAAARAVGVQVVVATTRSLRPEISGLGRARPWRAVPISAEVSGTVLRVAPALRAGRRLESKTIAVEIDPADYQAEVTRLEALRDATAAEAAQLETQKGYLAARVFRSARLPELDRVEAARQEDLQAKRIGTDRELDAARRAVVRSEDALASVRQALVELSPRLHAAGARLREVNARLATARRQAQRTRIRVPFAGTAARVAVEAHQRVAPGQVLFEIWETDRVEVPVALPLADAQLLSPDLGESARDPAALADLVDLVVVEEELPGRISRWSGKLTRFEPVDAATQTVLAVIEVSNTDAQAPLVPGVFCRVRLRGRAPSTGLAIPVVALQERDRVYLLRDGKLAIAAPTLGARLGPWVLVTSGLTPGSWVIVSPLDRVLEGTRLERLPNDPPPHPAAEAEAPARPAKGHGL